VSLDEQTYLPIAGSLANKLEECKPFMHFLGAVKCKKVAILCNPGTKQRAIFIVCDSRRRDARIEIGFEFRHAWRFVLLAAFFVQTHPSAPSLAEVILQNCATACT